MQTFSFSNIFGSNDNHKSSKKAQKRRQGRVCRIEELENREMLDAGLMSALDDIFAPAPETMPDYEFASTVSEHLSAATQSDGNTDSDLRVPAAAATNAGDVVNLGTLTSQKVLSYTVPASTLFSRSTHTGSFSFTLANKGDANSYIRLYGTSGDDFYNAGTYLKVNGQQTPAADSPKFSLEGYAAGTVIEVSWKVTNGLSNNSKKFTITINPPVATPTITAPPLSGIYLQDAKVSLSTTVNRTNGSASDQLTYQWQRSTDGRSWTTIYTTSSINTTSTTLPDSYISTSSTGTMYYRCNVTIMRDGYCSVSTATTDHATITVVALSIGIPEVGNDYITLKWNTSGNANYYIVERQVGSKWSQIGVTTSTSLTVSNLDSNTPYKFRVCAVNNDGNSGYVTWPDIPTKCNTPENFRCVNKTSSSMELRWEPSVGGANYYRLDRLVGTQWVEAGRVNHSNLEMYFTLPNLADNTNYTFRLVAVNKGYNGLDQESSPATHSCKTLCNAPTNLRLTGLTTTGITLAWNSPLQNGADWYKLERFDGKDWTRIGGNIANPTYTDSTVSPNTEYYYRVSACNSEGDTGPIAISPIKTLCAAPTNLRSTETTPNSIALAWNAPTNGADSYKLFYSRDNSTWTQIGGTITATSYLHEGLADNTAYYYKVVAVNSSGDSAHTPKDGIKTRCNAPTGLVEIPDQKTESSLTLKWTAPLLNGAEFYKLEYSLNGTTWTTVNSNITSTSTSITYQVSGLTANTEYKFRVSAGNISEGKAQYGAPGPITTAKTLASAPANFRHTDVTSSSITLAWDPVTGAEYYELQRSLDEEHWTRIGGNITGTTYTDSGLSDNTTYYYKVAVITSAGKSAFTNDRTTTLCNMPTGLTSPNQAADYIDLKWDAPLLNGAEFYKLEYSLNGEDWTPIGGTITETFYRHSGLTANTEYRYRVAAVNAEGALSEWSYAIASKTLCGTPLNFHRTEITADTITLAWAAPSRGADSYQLERSRDGESWEKLPDRTTALSYTVPSDQGYSYRVSAVNSSGAGVPTESLSDLTHKLDTPVVNWHPEGVTTVVLQWEPVENAHAYQVAYSEDGKAIGDSTKEWKELTSGMTTEDGFVTLRFTGTPDEVYDFRVIATRTGEFVNSDPCFTTIEMGHLDAPVLTWSTEGENNATILVQWHTVDNADAYQVAYSEDGKAIEDSTKEWKELTSGMTTEDGIATLRFTGTPGGVYVFRVIAVSTVEHITSDPAYTLPPIEIDRIPLSTPALKTVEAVSGSEIRVEWWPVENASGYEIQWSTYSKNSEAAGDGVHMVDASTASFVIPGLESCTLYYVRVIAQGTGQYKDSPSLEGSDTTKLNTPTDLKPISKTETTVKMSWGAVSKAQIYIVEWSLTKNFEAILGTTNTSDTSYEIKNLAIGTDYYVRVKAAALGEKDSNWAESGSVTPIVYDPVCWEIVERYGLQPYVTWGIVGDMLHMVELNAPSAELRGIDGKIDLSGCTELKKVILNDNRLTELDVSGCTALETLECRNNQLSQLDISGCVSLKGLQCYANYLTVLDVSGSTKLEWLNCANNRLTALDLSQNTEIQELYCSYNRLTTLDMSACKKVERLDCSYNVLETLNVTVCTALTTLWCNDNRLETLNVSTNTALTTLDCATNRLTFSELPSNSTYYSPQGMVEIELGPRYTVDLSSEYMGGTTKFTWYSNLRGSLSSGAHYTENNGVFTFIGSNSSEVLYCQMTNTGFPGLTLTTTQIGMVASLIPTSPVPVTVSEITQDSVVVSWKASENASNYELRYRVQGTDNWVSRTLDASATSCVLSGLLANTAYDIQVRGVHRVAVLVSNWAGTTFTTIAPPAQPPAQPANFAVKSGSVSSTSLTLTWSAQTGVTGYTLQYKLSSASAWTNYSTSIAGTANSIDVSGLTAGTKYDFRLIAKNADGNSPAAELRNIETVGLGTNYAVLFLGGYNTANNHDRYYNAVKDLYSVLVSSYKLAKENIYILYADGTNTGVDRSDGKNSDMSFASASNVLTATYTNFDSTFATLGSKMTANDHLLFFTYDHGGGLAPDMSGGGKAASTFDEETLTAWGTSITDKQVAKSVERIQQGYVTMVFSQCFSGGILDNIVDPVTGQKKISTNAHIYGMAASNHYEYSWSGWPTGFAGAFIDAINPQKGGNVTTSAAFVYTKAKDLFAPSSSYTNNGGTYANATEHPWGIGETFSIFVSASGNSYDSNFASLNDENDSLIITNSSTSTKNSLEFVKDKPVYINFAYSNPLKAPVSAMVTVVGGSLLQAKTFDLTSSSFTEDASGIGYLTANLNLGVLDSGDYTVCVELFVNGKYTVLERSFTVEESSLDISDRLTGAKPISLEEMIEGIIGDGLYGGKDVDVFRYDATAADIGKALVFSTMGDAMSTMPVDTYLRLFSAAGVELAKSVYSFQSGISSLFYTISSAGSYYIAVSSLTNKTYNPNTANSGSEGDVGHYRLSGSLADSKPDLSMFYDYCWIDNIVVSTSPAGTISGVDLTANDTLYVNYKFTNSGYAAAASANVMNRITIAGTNGYSRSEEFPMAAALAAGGFQTLSTNFNWGKLAAGTYTITVTLNATGVLSELPTENNTASWEFTVAEAPVTPVLDAPVVTVDQAETTENSVTLTWQTVSSAVGYEVQWTDGMGTWHTWTGTSVAITGTTARITISGLNSNMPYEFRVRSLGATDDAHSVHSDVVSETTHPTPFKFEVDNALPNVLTISWAEETLPSDSVFQYKRTSANGSQWMTWKGESKGNSTTIPGLAAGTYDVRLMDANGETIHSETGVEVDSADTSVANPLKPKVKVDKSATTIGSIALTWANNTKANAGKNIGSNARYVITCLVKSGKNWTPVEQFTTTDSRYTFTGLNHSTSYKFTVTAVNADGKQTDARGREVAVSVTAKTAKYTAVQKLKKAVAADTATLTWQPSTAKLAGATPSYEILWFEGGSKTPSALPEAITVGITGTTATITGLPSQMPYKFAVREIAMVGDTVLNTSLDSMVSVKTL